jgi:integrase/recombinase XerD
MRQAKVPTEQEFRRLLAVAAQSSHAARNRAALMLSYYAGLRVGEIAALSIADAYDQENQVRDQIMLRAEITKTKEARVVFVGDKLRKELERYRDSWTGTQPKPTRALLRSQKGAAFSANSLCQLLGRLYDEAGIQQGSSHSGRRWFITKLAHSGVSAKVIMTLAGHKNLTTTQRYIEVNDAMMIAAVDRL